MLFYFIYGLITLINKIIELYKIPWGIAANTHFTKHNKIAALCFCFLNSLYNFLRIAFKIADMIILLR